MTNSHLFIQSRRDLCKIFSDLLYVLNDPANGVGGKFGKNQNKYSIIPEKSTLNCHKLQTEATPVIA